MARAIKQVKSPMKKYTLLDMQCEFPNDQACMEWLFQYRYPNGMTCPKCGVINAKYHYVANRKCFACQWCGNQTFPTVGTVFEHSSTPLVKWFYAIYLMAQTRTGISAKQLERELGVTYKTAWRMFTEIRKRFAESGDAFGGEGKDVEVDETYIGGRRKGKRGRGAAGKTAVVGVVERKGRVKAKVVANTKADTVLPIVEANVEQGTTVHTDEYPVYNALTKKGYDHQRVTHNDGEFVRGNVHTNSAEGFWAQVKNAVNGVHHGVDPKYLQHYVNEYAFRYGHRNDTTPMFLTMLRQAGAIIIDE